MVILYDTCKYTMYPSIGNTSKPKDFLAYKHRASLIKTIHHLVFSIPKYRMKWMCRD